jgi:uncharacterized protein YuzE
MKDAQFVKCVGYGKEAEHKAAELFLYDEIEYAPTKCAEWDLVLTIDNEKTYLEVKRDKYLDKTGNICIEYGSNGKASGIAITTADFYLYMNDDMSKVWMIDTDYIRKMISKKKYHRDIKCGFGYLSRAYLFDVSLFEDFKMYN